MWLNSVISKACVNKSFYDIVVPYQRLQMGREGRQRTVIYSDIVTAYIVSVCVVIVSQLLSHLYGQDWVMEGSLEVNTFTQRATLNVQSISLRMVSADAEWHTNIVSSWLTVILLNRSYSERDLCCFLWKINERDSLVFRKAESGPQSTCCSPWQNQDSWTICRFKKKKNYKRNKNCLSKWFYIVQVGEDIPHMIFNNILGFLWL